MGVALEGRNERHLMRQRGAGARTITTNFGFVFQAGPIQLSDSANAPPSANCLERDAMAPEPAPVSVPAADQIEAPAVKGTTVSKKRKARKSDDIPNWFSKRPKATPIDLALEQDVQKAAEVAPPPVLETTVSDPPVETRPTKRKASTKRSAAPKHREKKLVKNELRVQGDDELPEQPKAVKKASILKTAVECKPAKSAAKPVMSEANIAEEEEDELSNDSLQSIVTSKPRSNKLSQAGRETAAPKKRVKAVPARQKKPTRNDETQPASPRPAEGSSEITEKKMAMLSPETGSPQPSDKVNPPEGAEVKRRRVVKKNAPKVVDQGAGAADEAANQLLAVNTEETVSSSGRQPAEQTRVPVKRKAATRRAAIKTEHSNSQSPNSVTPTDHVSQTIDKVRKRKKTAAEQDAAPTPESSDDARPSKEPPAPVVKRRSKASRSANVESCSHVPKHNLPQEKVETDAENKAPNETAQQGLRRPLSERKPNASPQRLTSHLKRHDELDKQQDPSKSVTKQRSIKKAAKPSDVSASIDYIHESTGELVETATTLGKSGPSNDMRSRKPAARGTTRKKVDIPVYEDRIPGPSAHTSPELHMKSSRTRFAAQVTNTDGLDLDLFEMEAPAFAVNKASKLSKRSFNDDSELDLDQMLDGIAAIAGGTTATASIITRGARRRP